jgi:hypothetical protein
LRLEQLDSQFPANPSRHDRTGFRARFGRIPGDAHLSQAGVKLLGCAERVDDRLEGPDSGQMRRMIGRIASADANAGAERVSDATEDV